MRSKRRREEEIKTVFNSSKKNFKRALGVLMKKNLITQDARGVPLPPIIPIYLVEYAYVLPHYCVYWGIY